MLLFLLLTEVVVNHFGLTEIMINTHKSQYKNLFHPLCMYHDIIQPVISSGISIVGGAVCRHQMLRGKGRVLHLLN